MRLAFSRGVSTTLLTLADVSVLLALHGAPARAFAAISAVSSSADTTEVDGVVLRACLAGLFVAAVWLALGLLVTAASTLPGALGSAAERVSHLLLPAVLRRVLAGAAGLGVVLAPVCASAGAQTISPGGPGVSTTASAPVPNPPTGTATLPAPLWPTAAAEPATPSTPSTPRSRPAPVPDRARVAPGDSLWLIAAHRLGDAATAADVARYWPRVYAHNRAVVGDDPALIHPGQRLTLPVPSTEELSP